MLEHLPERKRRYFTAEGSFILDELHHTEQKHVQKQPTLKVGEMAGNDV